MSTGLSPLTVRLQAVVPAAAQAAGDAQTVFVAPWAGVVAAVAYIADTAITGANTNTRKVSLVNRGGAGAGSTEMAALQFDSGINATAFDDRVIPLHATPANRTFAEGDVLTWNTAAVGAGLADPGGTVSLTVMRS